MIAVLLARRAGLSSGSAPQTKEEIEADHVLITSMLDELESPSGKLEWP
ncbi:MAG: hypothetical protein H7255_06405 [Ramlibacter sp.]|nr:hypothetical protein [Ramlibacter sp.]